MQIVERTISATYQIACIVMVGLHSKLKLYVHQLYVDLLYCVALLIAGITCSNPGGAGVGLTFSTSGGGLSGLYLAASMCEKLVLGWGSVEKY